MGHNRILLFQIVLAVLALLFALTLRWLVMTETVPTASTGSAPPSSSDLTVTAALSRLCRGDSP